MMLTSIVKKLCVFSLLATLPLSSSAFVIVLKNNMYSSVTPYVGEAPDQAGYLGGGKERVYDNSNPWLNAKTPVVREGSKQTVSFWVNDGSIEWSDCRPHGPNARRKDPKDPDPVTFRGGMVITLHENGECTVIPMGIMTEEIPYALGNMNYAYGWTVDKISTDDHSKVDDGKDYIQRWYAQVDEPEGTPLLHDPTKLYWSYVRAPRGSTVTVQVANWRTHKIEEVKVVMAKVNPCGVYEINNAVGCEEVRGQNTFKAYYDPDMNSDLPLGRYSGVAKIKGEKSGVAKIKGEDKCFWLCRVQQQLLYQWLPEREWGGKSGSRAQMLHPWQWLSGWDWEDSDEFGNFYLNIEIEKTAKKAEAEAEGS